VHAYAKKEKRREITITWTREKGGVCTRHGSCRIGASGRRFCAAAAAAAAAGAQAGWLLDGIDGRFIDGIDGIDACNAYMAEAHVEAGPLQVAEALEEGRGDSAVWLQRQDDVHMRAW
jgi:hypothetical protein